MVRYLIYNFLLKKMFLAQMFLGLLKCSLLFLKCVPWSESYNYHVKVKQGIFSRGKNAVNVGEWVVVDLSGLVKKLWKKCG